MPKRRSLEYHISLDVAVRNAKRLVANVRQNYARNPTCFDADGNALPPEEAIEDTLDALVESIYDALPESVEVRRDGSYEADGEPWTREHKRKLRRKRPLTPHHLDVYFSTEVYVSTPDLFWEVRVQCEHAAGLVRDTAVFLIERRRNGSGFDLWYKEHLLSERPTKRHSWKTRQRSYRRVSFKPYLEAVNRAWAQYLEPNPAGTFAQREEVLGKRQRDAARMERALERLGEHQKQVVNKQKTTVH